MQLVYLAEEVGAHRPIGMAPVAETDAVMVRVASEVDDNPHEDEADQGDDLDHAKPELQFSEKPDTEEIDRKD